MSSKKSEQASSERQDSVLPSTSSEAFKTNVECENYDCSYSDHHREKSTKSTNDGDIKTVYYGENPGPSGSKNVKVEVKEEHNPSTDSYNSDWKAY